MKNGVNTHIFYIFLELCEYIRLLIISFDIIIHFFFVKIVLFATKLLVTGEKLLNLNINESNLTCMASFGFI
jgi:hypothetical protein